MKLLIGFLHRGGIEAWSYAVASETVIQGNEFVRFTMDDVDFTTRTINGEVWENGGWIKRKTRFPDAIKNFELKKESDSILDIIPYSMGPVVKKDDQIQLLSKVPSTADYIPVSLPVNENTPIPERIIEWGGALLKPSRGRLGQGIIYIKKCGKKFIINENNKKIEVTKTELRKYLVPFIMGERGDYFFQQFAAGTGPAGRYFNVRVIVSKSGDGDWYTCNTLMSLLAPEGSIIANREVGAKNIDLESFLASKHGSDAETIYNNLFQAAVKITRALDDCVDASAEEIALDMAIDDSGRVWLHEANWRGGMWLFSDDVGFYRHGGLNLQALASSSENSTSMDCAESVDIAVDARLNLQRHLQQKARADTRLGVTFGLEVPRNTRQTVSLTTAALASAVPILAVSSASSFRGAQKSIRVALDNVHQQIQCVSRPYIISRGGMCVHDPKDGRGHTRWVQTRLADAHYITQEELRLGYSSSSEFLDYTIRQNCDDLGIDRIDLFIIEGLEVSLSSNPSCEEAWHEVTREMYRQVALGTISEWGYSVDASSIFTNNISNPEYLLSLTDDVGTSAPSAIFVNIPTDYHLNLLEPIITRLEALGLMIIICLPEAKLGKREWDELHECVDMEKIKMMKAHANKGHVVLCPAARVADIDRILNSITETKQSELGDLNPWFHNPHGKDNSGLIDMRSKNSASKIDHVRVRKSLNALAALASFDHRQLFRFFVDGRFQKKYRGWVGYEENEPGSVPAILSAYCHVFDNFDISTGLKSSYVRELHALCMKNVLTKNPKSAPGDMRYLEAGFNIFSHYSTKESIQEIIDRHMGEGVPLFHTRGFEKPADEFTAQGIFDALQEKNRLRFRPWYPKLTFEEKEALAKPDNLEVFYRVKHKIQAQFAVRFDLIIEEYNIESERATSDSACLMAISRVTRNLEMLHPFPDGNGRTFVAVLMNHLLLFHGFLPAILFDPNIDIELSVEQFAEEIEKGISNTKLLLEDPNATLFDYSIRDADETSVKDFEGLAKELIFRISPYCDVGGDLDNFEPVSSKVKYIYLTPQRIAKISGGRWLNVNEKSLSALRFESIQVEADNSSNQLLFLKNASDLVEKGNEEAIDFMHSLSQRGVTAVVSDNLQVGRISPLPTLYVEDVDDALAICGRTARRDVNCKSIAVVGSSHQKEIKLSLAQLLANQGIVHVWDGKDHKTPNVMASLANLRLGTNLEVAGIDVASRPNPVSYRSRRIEPNVVLMTSFAHVPDKESRDRALEAYGAVADGLREGGLYIINSCSPNLDDLINAIRAEREVSIQTFGRAPHDHGRLISQIFDEGEDLWKVVASILGKEVTYCVPAGEDDFPLFSVGMLLAAHNLGYDVELAAHDLMQA